MIERRLGLFAMFASLAIASAATFAPASGANLILPGTYNEVSPSTKRVLSVGNELVIVRDRRGRLAFSLSAIRLSDSNLGYIGGKLSRATGNVVWTSTAPDARCYLIFAPLARGMLQLTQDVRFGDCGFGYGVSGDALYKRTKATGKLGSWNGP